MTFWNVANSILTWFLVIAALVFVLGLCFLFLVRAYKRCLDLGIDSKTLKKVAISSVSLTIIPSLAIVVGLTSLASMVGRAWAWFRISVAGSVSYELLAAQMAAQALGIEELAHMREAPAFNLIAIMIVMSVGVLPVLLFNVLFLKKINTGILSLGKKNHAIGFLVNDSFLSTIIVIVFLSQLFKGIVPMLTVISSTIFALFIRFLSHYFKLPWLESFNIGLTMLVGMIIGSAWQFFLKG